MAHVEHFKMADVRRLGNELSRDKNYKCRDGRIDPDRTPDNYVMDMQYKHGMRVRSAGTLLAELKSRLNEVPHSSRRDLNVISSWITTCPQELLDDPAKVRRFFEVTYQFVQERYGKENVLQGFVHTDETTPHIHIPLVPVKDGRVSAKALFTRKELSSFHKDLDKVMEEEFGMKGLILNGRTKGNYSVQELKERTKDEKASEDLKSENSRLRAFNASLRAEADEQVRRAEEARKAAEAAKEQRDEAIRQRNEARMETKRIAESVQTVPERPDINDRRVLNAARATKGKDGKPFYNTLLEYYESHKGKNVQMVAEDEAARRTARLRSMARFDSITAGYTRDTEIEF